MKDKKVLIPFLIIGLLVSCRPIDTSGSSSVEPISVDPSEEDPGHEHTKDDSVWRYDSDTHWHDCTAHDGYRFDEASHTFSEQVIQPTYEAGGYTLHLCTTCGYYYTDNPTDQLVHHYSDEWSHNATEHWHACIDEGYEDLRSEVSSHTYNPDDDEVVEPTTDTAGYTRHTCETCGYQYDSDFINPTGEHHYSSKWTYDEQYHWHACTDPDCEAVSSKDVHHYDEPTLDTSYADVSHYIKGKYVYSCDTCEYEYQENAYYTKEEMCDLMNDYLNEKTYFDVFELKDDLLTQGYPVVDELAATSYFGYDPVNNLIAISDGTDITYPSAASYEQFVPFKEFAVTDEATLRDAIRAIAVGEKLFSSIKFSNNISLTQSLEINSSYPLEINLNNQTLDNSLDSGAAIKVSKGNAIKPVIAVKNGTIQTKNLDGSDISRSPSCVSVIQATSFRATGVIFNNRAEKGYCFIDYPDSRYDSKVKINNSTLNSKVVAICIQTNINVIDNNVINGVVVINGGSSEITNNTIDVTDIQKGMANEAIEFVTNQYLYQNCHDYYIDRGLNTYMLTTTDAVLIYDRRSGSGTYANPEVVIGNNTLRCKLGSDNTPYGYGIRYMDLAFDTSRSENSMDLGIIAIGNNVYSYCSSTPYNTPGGYSIWEANA